MERETVTVIVPTFNRARYLRECLDSLLAQSLPADEIIAVDDGSEDDKPSVGASFGSPITCLRKEHGREPREGNFSRWCTCSTGRSTRSPCQLGDATLICRQELYAMAPARLAQGYGKPSVREFRAT